MSKFKLYPEYKDSGIDWLGKVPEHWKIGRLKHLATIRNGRDHALVEAECGPYPVIGSGGQFSRATSYLYDGVSVLFGRKGTVDKPLYVKGRFWTVDTMFYSEINHSIADDKYLFYCALTIPFDYYATNTALPSMTQRELSNHAMNIPPKKEQAQIALFLDHETARMDELIAEQKRLIELLKEKRQAVISHAVTKGLEPDAPMKDSGIEWLGEVPEHWQIRKLSHLTSKIGSGKTPRGGSETYQKNGVIFLRSQNIFDEGLKVDDAVFIDQVTHREMSNSTVKPLDVLLNITGASIGRTALVPEGFPIANVNQHVCIIRPMKIFPHWLAQFIKSKFFKHQIQQAQTGAAREGLNFEELSKFIVLLPSEEEQDEIANYICGETKKIDALIQEAEKAIELMKERRSALISAAVTGKIDVRDWQPEKEQVEALAS